MADYPFKADPSDADARARRYNGHNPHAPAFGQIAVGNRRLVCVITVPAGPIQTQHMHIDNTDFSRPDIAIAAGLPLWKPRPNPDGPVSETEPEPDDIERSRFLD